MRLEKINATIEGGFDYPLPRMVAVEQHFPRDTVDDVAAAVAATVDALPRRDFAGRRIAMIEVLGIDG